MKWRTMILLLAVALLTACADKDVKTVPAPETPKTEEQTEEPAQGGDARVFTEEEIEQHNAELLDVLVTLVENYGMSDDIPSYNYQGLGVLDVQLIDFDDNGKQELFVFFQSNKNDASGIQTRYTEEKLIEIWSTNDLGVKELLYTSAIPEAENLCDSCSVYAAIVKQTNGTLMLHEEYIVEEADNRTVYLTTINGNEAITHTLTIENDEDYYHNDDLISEKQYEEFFEQFDEPINELVRTENGQPTFGTLFGKSATYVSAAIDRLTQYKYEVFNTYPEFTNDQLAYFNEMATSYLQATNVDIQDDSKMYGMLYHTIQHHLDNLPKTREGEYIKIPVTHVLDRYRSMYHNMPQIEDFDLPAFDEADYQTISLKDEDIYFYYEPYESVPNAEIIRDITRVYEIQEGIYYIVVNDTEMDYVAYEKHYGVDALAFEDLPLETYKWSEREFEYAKTDITRFMLVRQGDTTQYLYVGYVPLSLERLQSYITED